MTQRLEAKGIELNTDKWDDGSDHDDVTKIYVGGRVDGINYIYFDYVKNGEPKEGSFHGFVNEGFTQTFDIDHLRKEYLESVEGYYDDSNGIQGIQFKTNIKTSTLMGYVGSYKFSLAVKGKKIIGFHGSESVLIKSLGAYFTSITPTRLEAKGGKGGTEWDDGYDYDNVSKIHVRGGFDGIQFIRFDYIKNGQVKTGSLHGVSGRGFTQTFDINQLNKEFLVSIDGYYDETSGVIQGLQFKTNLKTFDMMGYDKGRKFSLSANGNKIIGFHGNAEKNLNSLGAYFTTQNLNKLKCKGSLRKYLWDDGSNYDGIRKVFVDAGNGVRCIRFEYDSGGKVEKTHRRRNVEDEKEFVVDYPNEFITCVEGTLYGHRDTQWITSLTFKTSKGRTSPTFGDASNDEKFVLEKKGNALVGFYGWSCNANLNALGAYYRLLPPPPPDANKLEAKGGDGGVSWDDDSFDGVGKIFIGLSENAVVFVKFMYYKDGRMIFGDDHGQNTALFGVRVLDLNLPIEYITSVEGSYDNKSGAITMLRFKTNKQTSPDFGVCTPANSTFVLHKDAHMIVGFHGNSSNMLLHKIGVHVIPI